MYTPKPVRKWTGVRLVVVLFAAGLLAAQVTTSQAADFDRLSPGDQKIAEALFEAQASSTASASQPLSLEQIAAMKLRGEGWGEIFQQMKAQGQVQATNLGRVVSEFNERHRTPRARTGTSAGSRGGGTPAVGAQGRTEGSVSVGGGWRNTEDVGVRSQTSIGAGVGAGRIGGDVGVQGSLGLGRGRRR